MSSSINEPAEIVAGAVYRRYQRWCDDQAPKVAAMPATDFWARFEPLCRRVNIDLRKKGGKVYCVGVNLAA